MDFSCAYFAPAHQGDVTSNEQRIFTVEPCHGYDGPCGISLRSHKGIVSISPLATLRAAGIQVWGKPTPPIAKDGDGLHRLCPECHAEFREAEREAEAAASPDLSGTVPDTPEATATRAAAWKVAEIKPAVTNLLADNDPEAAWYLIEKFIEEALDVPFVDHEDLQKAYAKQSKLYDKVRGDFDKLSAAYAEVHGRCEGAETVLLGLCDAATIFSGYDWEKIYDNIIIARAAERGK